MKIKYNDDSELVNMLKQALNRKNGYCPCKTEIIEENKCMCKEFRNQINDTEYKGYCHCMLFYKSK